MVVIRWSRFISSGWMIDGRARLTTRNGRCVFPGARRSWPGGTSGKSCPRLLATLFLRVGLEWHVWEEPYRLTTSHLAEPVAGGLYPWLAKLLSIVFSLNLLLCGFRTCCRGLVGWQQFSAPLRGPAANRISSFFWNPTLRIIGLLIAWQGFGYLFEPIRRIATQALYPGPG